MRGLIVLCFAALCSAAPQGYNYPNQPSGQYLAPTASGAGASVGFNNHGSSHSHHHQQQPLISKRFYIHSAPEEEEAEIQHREIVVGTPRKNYNVVFVKSPAAKQQKTKIRVIPAVNEDKTVIYVLAKKADQPQLETYVEEHATSTTKPEVFFIKYKTNEEAEHAQHSIQAEYDRLGGSSIISNEGVSPVSSVIGSLDGLHQGGSGNGVGFGSTAGTGFGSAAGADFTGAGASSSAYLPPVKKH